MYFVAIVLFLSGLSFYELGKNRSCHEVLYLFVLLVMTLLLCFRFGQGTDYMNYLYPYNDEVRSFDSYLSQSMDHVEWGWYAMLLTIRKLDIPFEWFIAFVSVVMMISLYRVLKFSPYKMTSLLLFFPTYYMTYCFSALRQGLAVCLFLGFGLKLFLERKYWQYLLVIVALSFIHFATIVLAVLPIAVKFKEKQLHVFTVLALLGAVVLSRITMVQAIVNILGSRAEYVANAEFSVGAIALRSLLFFIIWRLHHLGDPKDTALFREEDVLYRVYYFGFILFLFLSPFGLISQRLSMPMKTLEVILIPLELYRNQRIVLNRKITRLPEMAMYVLAITMVMNVECVKNINSYIDQQNYTNISLTNYPYVSVFDKDRVREISRLF